MMEHRNHMIPDDELNAVSGGASVQAKQQFQEGDLVKIVYMKGGSEVYNYGRVSDCEYDEALGTWTYQVEFGKYQGAIWVVTGYGDTYYPQSQLESWGGTIGSGYDAGDIFGK